MSLKFISVFSKTDWVKIIILLIISIICWSWVWYEWQKPILPPEWEKEIVSPKVR